MLKITRNPIFIILITLITIIFYISLTKTEQKSITFADQVKKLEVETADLKAENNALEKKLQNSGEAEKVIRDEFLMQKPGEYVVKVPAKDKEVVEKEKLEREETSVWEKWQEVLF